MGLYTPGTSGMLSASAGSGQVRSRGTAQALTFLLGDLVIGAVCFGIVGVLGRLGHHVLPGLLPMAIWFGVWAVWRMYQGLYPGYGKSPQTELRLHFVSTVGIAVLQLAAALAFGHLDTDSVGILLGWLLVLVAGLLVRYALRTLMIRAGQFGRDISVIGGGQSASLLVEYLKAHPEYGLRPFAIYDDNVSLHGQQLSGVPIRGDIELALREPRTEQALIAIPGARAEAQQKIINSVYAAFPKTWVIPDLFGVPNQAMQPHNIGSIASLEVRNNLRSFRSQIVKRAIDLIGAGIGTVLISPILFIIVLAIKLDSPGPAVYRARRLGRNGQLFDCFKFRSMHHDAEAKLQEVLASNSALRAEFEATHKLKDDPRVTRVGAFLRKTSLDELPQLFNVLKGEMSLVGPRPIVTAEIEKYGEVYEIYKQVYPGMTGYWQANGRSDTSYDERVGMDKFYVTNWSLWLDIVVLIQTVKVVLVGKGAY